ncbi:hypothetical protein M758_N020700 [Ceratodon purpureus]|nr:hypothetical protein M758_N020700 [Ceratodon purpureus]
MAAMMQGCGVQAIGILCSSPAVSSSSSSSVQLPRSGLLGARWGHVREMGISSCRSKVAHAGIAVRASVVEEGKVTPLVTTEQVGEAEVGQRQELFNKIAPMYDSLNDWLSLGQHRVWKRMAVAWSGAKRGDRALDICCGSGDVSFLLAGKVKPTGSVVGLDYAQEQLDVAARRESESSFAGGRRIDWRLGDALALPFEDGSFDAVTMAYGLRNVASVPLALKEIHAVLKPGAKASILDFNRSENEDVVGFQGWMLDNLVVPVASQFGMQEEYAYLKTSIARFPTGPQQEELAISAGFSTAVHYELAGGLMGVLVLTK